MPGSGCGFRSGAEIRQDRDETRRAPLTPGGQAPDQASYCDRAAKGILTVRPGWWAERPSPPPTLPLSPPRTGSTSRARPDADVPAAIAAAHDYALDNYGVTEADWAACEDPGALTYKAPATTYDSKSYSATECISYDDYDAAKAGIQPQSVRVVAPIKGVKLVFGSVFGASKLDVSAQARASLKLDSFADCALCVVGFGPHDLQNGDASIAGGSVAINGDVSLKSQGGLTATGEPNEDGTINADEAAISVSGTATGTSYSPAPLQHQEPVDDPLAALPLPTDLANVRDGRHFVLHLRHAVLSSSVQRTGRGGRSAARARQRTDQAHRADQR